MKSRKQTRKSTKKTNGTYNRYRARFINAAQEHKTAKALLQKLGNDAIEHGADKDVLRGWLLDAGYSKSQANDTALAFWHKAQGTKPGKTRGPKTDERAVKIYQYAVRQFGKDAKNLLLASWKYAKKQSKK